MPLQTDPSAFSITALLADQVALVARNQKLPPGAASALLRTLMEGPAGRRRLLRMMAAEQRSETNAVEAAKAAAVLAETMAWIADLDRRDAPPEEDGVDEAPAPTAAPRPPVRRTPRLAGRRGAGRPLR